MNKILEAHNKTVLEDDILAIVLGKIIEMSEQGKTPNKPAVTFLLHKSMETTKADPYADPGQHDPLLEMAEFIVKTDMLPTKNKRLNTVLLKCFKKEKLGSSRRASRARYNSDEYYAHKILSAKGFMDLDLLIPSEEAIEAEKNKRQGQKKLKFPKKGGEY